jgi:AcrR family transcriptional regulator
MSKGEETKQWIIERAAPVFNTKGIAATAMSDIMEVTGLSKGSLYVHFENKDELAGAVVDYNMNLLAGKVQAVIDKAVSARDKLLAFIDILSTPVTPPVTGGCPMLNFGTEADDTNEMVKKKVLAAVKYSQQLIAEIIKKGIEKGEFKAGWNYTAFATIMFAMLEGGQLICRVAGSNSKMKVIAGYLRGIIEEHCI